MDPLRVLAVVVTAALAFYGTMQVLGAVFFVLGGTAGRVEVLLGYALALLAATTLAARVYRAAGAAAG